MAHTEKSKRWGGRSMDKRAAAAHANYPPLSKKKAAIKMANTELGIEDKLAQKKYRSQQKAAKTDKEFDAAYPAYTRRYQAQDQMDRMKRGGMVKRYTRGGGVRSPQRGT
jgi:hypothetical protein